MTATTPPATVLDYQPPPAPTEFELELVSERTRWLRRRFLWFCGVNIIIEIALFLAFARDISKSPALSKTLNIFASILMVGSYLGAFIYVARQKPSLERLLRLALYITAALPSLSLILRRIDFSLDGSGWEVTSAVPAGAMLALTGPWVILSLHLIACMFIPWTVKECLLPAAAMLMVNFAIVGGDMILTLNNTQRFMAMFCLLLSAVAPLPGVLICWWRYSRFRKRFRLTFESLGYRRLQHEIAGARRVHESSLPPIDMLTRGPICLSYVYEPMRQIGGDILVVHPADNPSAEVLSVLLVDVNGHGFGAALMANRVIGEIERLFAEHPQAGPHEMLTALNRYVRLTMAKSAVYATALCIRIDSRANTLEYASGGHPPAFLKRKDRSVTRLEAGTYLLGVFEGDDYCPECKTVQFCPGDSLLAYTDGATEARNLSGEMFNLDGIQKRVAELDGAPARWAQSLLHQIIGFRRGPAEDDTLLVTVYRV